MRVLRRNTVRPIFSHLQKYRFSAAEQAQTGRDGASVGPFGVRGFFAAILRLAPLVGGVQTI